MMECSVSVITRLSDKTTKNSVKANEEILSKKEKKKWNEIIDQL